jgi:hypothetical protein
MDERYAHITCRCGQKFQILRETVSEDGETAVDWDELATAEAYSNHGCEEVTK